MQTALQAAWRVFRAKMEELQEMMGEKMLPILTRLIDLLIKMAGWLEKHPSSSRRSGCARRSAVAL